MKLTKEEAVKLHRELWGWLAENPMKHKADWPGFKDKGHIINRCFCCEFTADIKREIDCIKCPLVWPGGRCDSSLFGEWEPAKLPEERSRLAALIRDLPEKKEEKPALKVGDWVKVLRPGYNFGSRCTYIKHNAFSHLPWQSPEEGKCYEVVAVSEKQDSRYGYVYALKSRENTICYMHKNYIDGTVGPDGLELTDPPAPKYQIGDKVVPVSKSVGDSFEAWTKHRKKDYVTVQQLPPNKFGNFYICNGDYFLESDLIPYIEPEVKPEPVKEEPKPAFKVGDRVRVKKDLMVGEQYDDGCYFTSDMSEYCGEETVITTANIHGYGNRYNIDIDNGRRSWSNSMLELFPPINQCPEPKTYTESKAFTFKGNKTTCIIEIDGRKYKGCAKCDPADEWNEDIGKRWAELRATRKILDACEKELRG